MLNASVKRMPATASIAHLQQKNSIVLVHKDDVRVNWLKESSSIQLVVMIMFE